MKRKFLTKSFYSNRFNKDNCFICKGKNKITREHIFPKWLQSKFELWNDELSLLNGDSYQYKNLTIPCCFNCNNRFGDIEKIIEKGVKGGFLEFSKINKIDLFFWLGKIFYGIIYKELFVLKEKDLRKKSGFIVSEEIIESLESHRIFLNGALNFHQFVDFFPASIFIFELQKPKNIKFGWGYKDDINILFISCIINDIGIVAVLQDGKAQESLNNKILDNFYKTKLHPIQFWEASAIIRYRASLFNRLPKYVSIENNKVISTIQSPLQGLSLKKIFDDFDINEYVKFLSFFTGYSVENLMPISGKVKSFISKSNGDVNFIKIEQ